MRMSQFRVPAVVILFAGLVAPMSAVRGADEGDETYTTAEEAPQSYQLQGEYLGRAGDDDTRYGAQVIALGGDNFRLVGYAGGLPGDGWDPAEPKIEIEGRWDGEKVEFKGEKFTVRLTPDGRMVPTTKEDGTDRGELNRVERTSPTMGKEAPEGALVLFDGTSADKFKNGKIVQDNLLLADCESEEKFGDHSMHLEFRVPFKPHARGQARGNSGVYIQGRYELQVLDSFGLSGEDNECGGIYQIAKPKVNMCLPPLQWQTYDIDFTAARFDDSGNKTKNARVTIRHNGEVVHQDLELPKHTPGRYEEADAPGPLYLQGHGNPVAYRNIWVVKKGNNGNND